MQSMQWKRNELPEPMQELMKQRQELRRQQKELVKQLYEFIAELEGRPVQKPGIGFPFNVIMRFMYRALGTIEALIRRTVAVFIK